MRWLVPLLLAACLSACAGPEPDRELARRLGRSEPALPVHTGQGEGVVVGVGQEAAGLREGDVILTIDGIAATGADALLRALGGDRVGIPAEVVALRGPEVLRASVVPAEREG